MRWRESIMPAPVIKTDSPFWRLPVTALLEQLAASLDLTRERVRQIQLEALQTLRAILRCEGVSRDGVF